MTTPRDSFGAYQWRYEAPQTNGERYASLVYYGKDPKGEVVKRVLVDKREAK